ncbi:MAG: thioredoxin family protein [Desulfobacterales bacterium]
MGKSSGHSILRIRPHAAAIVIFLLLSMVSCKNDTNRQTQSSVENSVISSIENTDQFNKIIEISKERLLLLDFYADWCPPCKELAPILEKIAKEKSATVTIYRINIDRNRELSNSFRITGIPHVAFFKNKENVFSLTGLYPKNMYLKVIEQYAETGTS